VARIHHASSVGASGCAIVGRTVTGYKGTVMPGACQFLGRIGADQTLRDEYKEAFAGNAEWAAMAAMGPPAIRTHAAAVAEGELVASGRKDKKVSSFVAVDVLSSALPGFDKIQQNKYDLAHQFGNIIKHKSNFIRNLKGSQKSVLFSAKKLQVIPLTSPSYLHTKFRYVILNYSMCHTKCWCGDTKF
jgi:hypothetical protein